MKKLLLTLCAFSAVCVLQGASRSKDVVFIGGERYYLHSVEKGETVHSLSRLYDVEVKQIYNSNEALREQGLQMGSNIKIPFETEELSARKLKRDFTTHKLIAGETLYAISKLYSCSLDDIMAANPELDPAHISVGTQIYIPKVKRGKASADELPAEPISHEEVSEEIAEETLELDQPDQQTDSLVQQSVAHYESIPSSVNFTTLAPGETLRISLLLPLSSSSRPLAPFIEFYHGFLLGLEELKQSGRDIDLMLYNTLRDKAMVSDIVSQERFQSSHLIVGPIYEDLLMPILEYAESHAIPVVSPLASLNVSDSEVLYQLAPVSESRYDKIEDMFGADKNITFIYGANNDEKFEQEILPLLDTMSFARHIYSYEHPGDVQKREREYELMLESLPSMLDADMEITEFYPSQADLARYINNGMDNTIVILANSETEIDRILAAFASAYVSVVSRGGDAPRYHILANPDWSRLNSIDRSLYFTNGVVNFTSYHAKRDAEQVTIFDSKYVSSFDELPSLYAYRGYDTAKIFGEAMYDGIDGELLEQRFTPLHSSYAFGSEGSIKRNRNWMRVEYNRDFTITVE